MPVMARQYAVAVLVAIVLVTWLPGCGVARTPNARLEVPSSPRVLHSWLVAEPATFDVQRDSTFEVYELARCLFSTLVRYRGSSLELEPELLAEMPRVSGDGLLYTFTLQKDVRLSDGVTHLSARDVKYTIERMLDPAERGANAWIFLPIRGARDFAEGRASDVAGVRVVDDLHFELTLEAPHAPFLANLAVPSASIYSEEIVRMLGDKWERWPVGTGPFRIQRHNPDERLVLERNPFYFESGVPRLAKIDYRIIPDLTTALMEFEAGTLDVTPVPIADFERLAASGRYTLLETNALNTYYLMFNLEHEQFRDARVRRAMALAVDRARLVNGLLSGHAAPALSFVPPGMPGAFALGEGPALDYAPEKARELLAEAGAVGQTIEIWQAGGDQVSTVNVALQAMFRDIGLDYRVVIRDAASFFADRLRGRVPGHQGNWWADVVDPDSFLYPFFHSQASVQYSTNYHSPQVDVLLERARGLSDPEERWRLYQEVEQIVIARDVAVIPLFHLRQNRAAQPTVEGLVLSPTNLVDYRTVHKAR